MGKGGSDGCADGNTWGAHAEPRVLADFTDPEHVLYMLRAYQAYEHAIEAEDGEALLLVFERARPFNYCSNKYVGFKSRDDSDFAFIVNEFAYQSGKFSSLIRKCL
jgi:hypothetical protein